MTQQFEEPPELFDSTGDKIVVFRQGDGTLFSNHPEYAFAMAMHQQQLAKASETEQPAVDTDEVVEEDVPEAPDNADGVVEYEEMTSQDLVALAKKREITLPDRKRSTAIQALKDWDAENPEA